MLPVLNKMFVGIRGEQLYLWRAQEMSRVPFEQQPFPALFCFELAGDSIN
jgi:hypothetical protein